MALQKQIHIYSVDTSAFYNEREMKFHKVLNRCYRMKKDIKKKLKRKKDLNSKQYDILVEKLNKYNSRIHKFKNYLYTELSKHDSIRYLNKNAIVLTKQKPETKIEKEEPNKHNIVSVFESSLTRTIQIPENDLSLDIIIVKTYFFDVIEDIILDGFIYEGEKYVCLTASAGQIRTKKTVFIKESVLKNYEKTLMCGLTVEDINSLGGVNVNKYLAYLALSNSATDLWEDFDITKTIVVDDLETLVTGEVDFIDRDTYEITRKIMDVPICHTDGCGIILPQVSKKNFMIRLPWVKGLLVSFPFDKFIADSNAVGVVKDIYGKEHDILAEGIEIIFTKSQFKMWKYYKSWQHYIDNFIKYNCQAGVCNEEEDHFKRAKINYQMMQSLTDITNEELEVVCKTTKNNIKKIGSDRTIMLKVFGVTKYNKHKTCFQQALELYPELLVDTYTKEILKQIKKSLVKEGRSARFEIDGLYTFICPDMYSFCEYLFLGIKNPKGLLNNGEVFCRPYKHIAKLDCLRSPSLYREHAVRNNVVDSNKEQWFITNGLYTSTHDLISKILQFDCDGDKSLVCAEPIIVEVAERNMQGIVPLYYEMAKAGAEIITKQSIFNGLKTAYTGGNIGAISNDISKIWNSENVNLDAIKLLCMENNFVIDYAKTLFKPERPKFVKKLITSYTRHQVPHFFIYAKDKMRNQVEKNNDSTVNRLEKIIPNPIINFTACNLGKFNYKMLMKNQSVEIDDLIVKKYKDLSSKNQFMMNKEPEDEEEESNLHYFYQDIKKQLLAINSNITYVTDVLIEYLYGVKNSRFKETLWQCFGDIILENLKNNIEHENIYCEKCGTLVEKTNNKRKYCEKCYKELHKKWQRESMNKLRNKNVN